MNKINDIAELPHKIQLYDGKRIAVCVGHFCDLDGVSEYTLLQRQKALKEKNE